MKKFVSLLLCLLLFVALTPTSTIAAEQITGPLGWSDPPMGWCKFTPVENSFTVDGKKFALLEYRKDNQESKYFVISQDGYGRREFDIDNTQKFDMSDNNNIAYWLNNEFLTDGNNYNGVNHKLPQGIIDHINPAYTWITECGWDGTNCSMETTGGRGAYDTVAGVALMADFEYKKYAGKFGVLDNIVLGGVEPSEGDGWLLRSTCQQNTLCSKYGASMGCVHAWSSNLPFGIRPIFNLNSEFFKNVKVGTADLGENVRLAIADSCAKSDLKKLGYTKEELTAIFGSGVNFGEAKFTDNSGNVIKDLVGNMEVNCEVKITNNDETVINVTEIFGFYDGDGTLSSCATTSKTAIMPGGNAKLTAKITLPENVVNGNLKVFFWDSLTGMNSLN